MTPRTWLWILAPLALSAGVLWLSAQEAKSPPEGIRVSDLAEKVSAREKAVAQKEAELRQLEQQLNTLKAAVDKDRQDLDVREKAVQEATAKLEGLKNRPPIDPQLTRTYEAMDPVAGAQAVKELARLNPEVAVSLLGSMAPKKAARLMDQLAPLDAKLAALLSEKVGLSKPKA